MSGVSTSQDIEALPEDCLLLRSLKVIQTQFAMMIADSERLIENGKTMVLQLTT